jgi:hypothetical protein
LHDTLRDHADQHQVDRDPTDPDLFRLQLGLTDRGNLHMFDFGVNDRRQPGRLFVVEVVHTLLGPFP